MDHFDAFRGRAGQGLRRCREGEVAEVRCGSQAVRRHRFPSRRRRTDSFSRPAEAMHNLLELTLAPGVPASVRHIPIKYNVIMRLWSHAFNKPLQALRNSSFSFTRRTRTSSRIYYLRIHIPFLYFRGADTRKVQDWMP